MVKMQYEDLDRAIPTVHCNSMTTRTGSLATHQLIDLLSNPCSFRNITVVPGH